MDKQPPPHRKTERDRPCCLACSCSHSAHTTRRHTPHATHHTPHAARHMPHATRHTSWLSFALAPALFAAALQCDRRQAIAIGAASTSASLAAGPRSAQAAQQQLVFSESPSGLRAADIEVGGGDTAAAGGSRVSFHVYGRLVGKNGWIFMNSQEDDEGPLRVTLGAGQMILGLEEGVLGMRAGGRRRLVVPSRIGYDDRARAQAPQLRSAAAPVRHRPQRSTAEAGARERGARGKRCRRGRCDRREDVKRASSAVVATLGARCGRARA